MFSTPISPSNIENNLPVSPSLISFDLDIKTECDFDSLSPTLRCMPNLRRFTIVIWASSFISSFWEDSLNGQYWQELLTSYVPRLNIFDLFLKIFIYRNSQLDINSIIHSFDYFATKYNDWYLKIDQSKCCFEYDGKIIIMIYF